MAERKPYVDVNGVLETMPSGDVIPVSVGGTGADTASGARANLGAASATDLSALDTRVGTAEGAIDALAAADTALDGRLDDAEAGLLAVEGALDDHLADTSNPHEVNAAQVGAVPTARTLTTTAPLTIDGGGSADLSGNRTLAMPVATNSVDGYLSAADRTAFNAKQAALTGTGDVPGLTSALAGKQATLTAVADVPGLTSALAGKQDADADLTALAGITVARGTIPVGSSSPAWSGLAKGAAYLPLRMDSSGNDPGYGALQPQGGGTGLTALGSPLQALRVNAAGTALEYYTPESGSPMLEIDSATDWGDGSDGAVVYSSNTTLTSDVQATTVVVNSGVTVSIGWNSTAGRPALMRATVSITVNGTISAKGTDGSANVAATGGAGGASLTGGGGGGGGSYSSGSASVGGTSGRPSSNGSAGTTAGVGGAGGPGDIAAGGAGQTGTYTPGAGGVTHALMIDTLSTPAGLWISGGGSGGGGGSRNSAAAGYCGGGGGGGGGTILLASPVISISSTGTLDASGGAGGVGTSSGGDGGGGGGGRVTLLAEDVGLRGGGVISVAGGTSATEATAGADGQILIAATAPVALSGLDATVIPARVV